VLVAVIIAFLSGITRTLGRSINAQLGERIGPLQSTLYNYISGFICSILAMLLSSEIVPVTMLSIGHIPLWAYFGGAVGVLFIVVSNIAVPKISAFSMTLLLFVGQLATGVVIDVVVGHQLSIAKIAGGVLIVVGLLHNLSIDAAQKGNAIEAGSI
jgi:bacterial/archaeal transporter family-2 protein